MDKQRDQESNNPSASEHAFSNSMMEDNSPSNDGSPNAGANDNDTRGIGAPERQTYKNAGVDTPAGPGYPLPADPHAPPGYPEAGEVGGKSAELADFGLNEEVEVGRNASVNQYGLTK